MSTANAKVTITPRMLAEAFWDMADLEQVTFFSELSDVIGDAHYGHGEAQWCHLADRLNEDPKAKEMACALTAWIFVKFMQQDWRST